MQTELRLSKILLLGSVATYCTLVAFNNISDYGSNFAFVEHVLRMDTTFPDNRASWRAIDSAPIHHAAYVGIIGVECLVAVLSWLAALRLWQSRADTEAFRHNKRIANYALLAGVLLWFTGFIVIGGEWFAMWQSQTWNGTQSAFRIATFQMLVMIFLNMDD